jgi:PhnB protein
MASSVKPIPDGYHRVTPYLIVKGAAEAIAWYARAFGAEERFRMMEPDGRVGHAELKLGDSIVMLADEFPERDIRGPRSVGGTPVSFCLYVEDVDATVERAVREGATLTRPVADQFYGDRTGGVTDPWGHSWFVMTHVEDVSPEELRRRSAERSASQPAT